MLGFTIYTLFFAGVLGATVGSFANVVIFRLPEKRSVVFPRSSCPNCGYTLQPLDLVPIFSWLALGRKCRQCRQPISARYPAIEGLMAIGYILLAWRYPLLNYGFTVIPLWILYSLLVIMSMIDVDHYILPDSLTLPAIVVGILGTFVYSPMAELPTLSQATFGSAIAAGIIVLINRMGSLLLRRFTDTKERLYPVGMDQVNIAALAGLLGGVWIGLAAAIVSLIVNISSKKIQRIPEQILYGMWFLGLFILPFHPLLPWQKGILGSFAAAGVVAVLGATFWWIMELTGRISPIEDNPTITTGIANDELNAATISSDEISNQSKEKEAVAKDNVTEENGDDIGSNQYNEPIAMGFGDVKLAAVLGTFLGWQLSLVALFLSFIVGAVGGIISRLGSGAKLVPFGPYLAIAGMLALLIGRPLLQWYLGFLGL